MNYIMTIAYGTEFSTITQCLSQRSKEVMNYPNMRKIEMKTGNLRERKGGRRGYLSINTACGIYISEAARSKQKSHRSKRIYVYSLTSTTRRKTKKMITGSRINYISLVNTPMHNPFNANSHRIKILLPNNPIFQICFYLHPSPNRSKGI